MREPNITRVTNGAGEFVDGYTDPSLSETPLYEVDAWAGRMSNPGFRAFGAGYDSAKQALGAAALLVAVYPQVSVQRRDAVDWSVSFHGWESDLTGLLLPARTICDANVQIVLAPAVEKKRERKRMLRLRAQESRSEKPQPARDHGTPMQRPPRSITPAIRTRIMQRDAFRCRRCGVGPDDAKLVIDHIIPVARGGSGDDDNLQTLCWSCNSGKRDSEPHEHDLRISA